MGIMSELAREMENQYDGSEGIDLEKVMSKKLSEKEIINKHLQSELEKFIEFGEKQNSKFNMGLIRAYLESLKKEQK